MRKSRARPGSRSNTRKVAEEEEEEREAVDYQEKGPREGRGGRKEWKGVTEPLKKRGRGGKKKGLWCFCLLLPGNKKGEKVGCSPLTRSAAGWADIACLLWLPSPPRRRPLCAAEKKSGRRYGEGERRRSGNEFPACPSTKSAAAAK